MKISRLLKPLTCVFVLIGLQACSDKAPPASATAPPSIAVSASAPPGPASTAASAPAAASQGGPVTVTTVKAQKRDFAVTLKANGSVVSLNSVDVKAQVSSTVSRVHLRDGQFVSAGQLLFTLDSRVDDANAAKARAQIAKDTTALADARRQLERARQLLAQNFVSQGAIDTAQAQVDTAAATVASDQAALDAIKVSQSFARVTAPQAGRVGVVSVSVGSAVQANQTTLVTITQLNPIAVGYSIPQRNLVDALAALQRANAPVTATLADGGGTFSGRLSFVDNAVDAASGTVKVRATFSNKENRLWPGAFVDVSQTLSRIKDAVVIPQAAIIQAARGAIVYVVEDGKATQRPVKINFAEDGLAAVDGLKAGETVVLDGKQNLRPGSAVAERAKQ